MLVKGKTFCFEVPDGWESDDRTGQVIAVSGTASLGFMPNPVLRESRIDERRDALAAVSQARLRSSEGRLPGTLTLGVQALERHGVEHRRLWYLLPLTPDGLHGNVLSILGMQELVVAEGVVAELTVSVPLVEWNPGDLHHAMLDTLKLLPPEERTEPETRAEVPVPELDEWATARDGKPREELTGVEPPELVLQGAPLVLSDEAVDLFTTNAQNRVFAPVTGDIGDELAAAGLVDEAGNLTPDGFWYADHILSGEFRRISFAGPERDDVRFWFTDPSAVLAIPHPEQEGLRLLGYCPSNDLFRLFLSWAGITPSWPMEVNLELDEGAFRAKADRGVVPQGHDGDAGEFLTRDWRLTSLSGLNGSILNWIHTDARGDAMVWDGSRLNNTIIIEQNPSEPFWWTLIEAVVKEGEE